MHNWMPQGTDEMAYIACPFCSADFFVRQDELDFVCPGCGRYFALEALECVVLDKKNFQGRFEPLDENPPAGDFDAWAYSELKWMQENSNENLELKGEEQRIFSSNNENRLVENFCLNHGQVDVVQDIFGKKRCKKCLEDQAKLLSVSSSKDLSLSSRSNTRSENVKDVGSGVCIPEIPAQCPVKAKDEGEPTFFKIALPIGAAVVCAQLLFEPFHEAVFLFAFYIWGFISIIGLSFWLGLGGRGIRFGAISTLSLLSFVIMVLSAIIVGFFSGGGSSGYYEDCIEVGRYGELQCY